MPGVFYGGPWDGRDVPDWEPVKRGAPLHAPIDLDGPARDFNVCRYVLTLCTDGQYRYLAESVQPVQRGVTFVSPELHPLALLRLDEELQRLDYHPIASRLTETPRALGGPRYTITAHCWTPKAVSVADLL